MTVLLSTIILNLTIMLGGAPTQAQVNNAVMADQQAGIIVVPDTISMN
jgi:hypothetical protein